MKIDNTPSHPLDVINKQYFDSDIQRILEGSKVLVNEIKLTNVVNNGDFSDGANGWRFNEDVNVTIGITTHLNKNAIQMKGTSSQSFRGFNREYDIGTLKSDYLLLNFKMASGDTNIDQLRIDCKFKNNSGVIVFNRIEIIPLSNFSDTEYTYHSFLYNIPSGATIFMTDFMFQSPGNTLDLYITDIMVNDGIVEPLNAEQTDEAIKEIGYFEEKNVQIGHFL